MLSHMKRPLSVKVRSVSIQIIIFIKSYHFLLWIKYNVSNVIIVGSSTQDMPIVKKLGEKVMWLILPVRLIDGSREQCCVTNLAYLYSVENLPKFLARISVSSLEKLCHYDEPKGHHVVFTVATKY